MSSQYRANYHLRAHKRDEFIEFIKSLLLTPFILHANSSDSTSNRYLEIFECIEHMVQAHMLTDTATSRLSQIVPSIGTFFTALPLREAFILNDQKRSISGRKHVAPSFNDVRHILNSAQVSAIAKTLKLITLDGDMTLYSDGKDFAEGDKLAELLVGLLAFGVHVAVVTAAAYGEDCARYEKRLSGLLDAIRKSTLAPEQRSRFFVFESNLVFISQDKYSFASTQVWSSSQYQIKSLIDTAESCFNSCITDMNLSTRTRIIRKEKAIGVVSVSPFHLTREQLDEFAISAQRALNSHDHVAFCAFNGGSDVWVDVGNKQIGVAILQLYLQAGGNEVMHVGDQFLSTGNDIATRRACTTVWIINPQETADVLEELIVCLK